MITSKSFSKKPSHTSIIDFENKRPFSLSKKQKTNCKFKIYICKCGVELKKMVKQLKILMNL